LKRRLNLAIGLLNEPRLLCLDEPTVGIDPHSRHYILERIRGLREQGMTVIYTSHYMDEVQRLCDSVAIIEAGRILVKDRVERLLGRYADNHLRIRVNGADDALRRRVLDAFPGAVWTAASGELELGADDPLAALSSVRDMTAGSGARIDSFEYVRTSLEDIYLRVSGKPWDGDDATASDLD
jgi:ABC-2 type transport system ATP-binding protein